LKEQHGFSSHKLKGGVFPPEYELECYRGLASELSGDSVRFDPNAVWSTETVIPNLSFAADAHYHHLTDDIIQGGKFNYQDGVIAVPSGPGLGVRLDRDKLAEYEELYRRLGSYPYDQDPLRPRWTPIIPNDRWADPNDASRPTNIRL
jgi:L-alanine-DL-glutamate epimerase-like enolase superfamily enzyme